MPTPLDQLPPLSGQIGHRLATIACPSAAVELLVRERLYGILNAEAFDGLSQSNQQAVNEALGVLRTQAELRHAVRCRDLRAATAALAERNIFPIALKGAALVPSVYHSAIARPSIDVDLFIPPESVPEIHRTMETLGWTLSSGIRGRWVSSQFAYRSPRSDALSTTIDFHWRLTNRPRLNHALSYDELRAHAIPQNERYPFAHRVSLVHALVHAVVHLVAHHRSDDIPAIWHLDIAALDAQLSSQERRQAIKILRTRGLLPLAAKAWQQAAKSIGFSPSKETKFLLDVVPQHPSLWQLIPSSRVQEVAADLSSLRPVQRIYYLRELIFPPESSIRAAYGDSDKDTALWRLHLRRLRQRGVRRAGHVQNP